MPWTPKQHRLFCMMAGDSKQAQKLRKKHKMSKEQARKYCREGIAKKL